MIFQFNKGLPSDISRGISQLENSFHIAFQQMVYFRKELDRHTGKAAFALRTKMDDDISFLSKSANSMLYFADVINSFVKSLKLVDEGIMACSVPLKTRAEQQYAFSPGRQESEIKLNAASLKDATKTFQTNLTNFQEILTHFNNLLEKMLGNTRFPWEDVSEVWHEAKQIIGVIMQEAIMRVNNLLNSAEEFFVELERLDNLIAFTIQHEK